MANSDPFIPVRLRRLRNAQLAKKLRQAAALPTPRRERRAAWRALRAFLPGSARAIRREAFDASLAAAQRGEDFIDAYHAVLEKLRAVAPKHAVRTAQWRAMWTDPKAGYRVGPLPWNHRLHARP